jgi:PIN domain nuclease of toxin-antitoxin system
MFVLDTHALLWWLGDAGKLGSAARRALRRVTAEQPAVVSCISLFEITTAVRRGRLELSLPVQDWLDEAAALPEVRFEPVTPAIAMLAGRIGDELHGDPGDRLIVATALHMALPLVSADAKLQAIRGLKTLW